jgi:succinate dehydrogenase / fumarate reductase iron-sulfur subunit
MPDGRRVVGIRFANFKIKNMKLKLKIWRQKNAQDKGAMVDYQIDGIEPDMSFLEMLDVFNEDLSNKGGQPVSFDHDCREGICGMCSLYINGKHTDRIEV